MSDWWRRITAERWVRILIGGVFLALCMILGIGIPYAIAGQPWVWLYVALFLIGVTVWSLLIYVVIMWVERSRAPKEKEES